MSKTFLFIAVGGNMLLALLAPQPVDSLSALVAGAVLGIAVDERRKHRPEL
jgi:hypothetical protein